eukprot:CAMPEP_0182445742 /NCGR_PEP_ID=MMETSP1172-20130603/3763_1 /TAXON_ID=708627 /ORGANISM="Timspurckia oligopyrenoides, Strain CCMP3278" /LENGTH=117 /DNA_ID=CAMNT_0024641561 /DNA_START=1 /DNA_END=354 /DNA_ORIENTATION=+
MRLKWMCLSRSGRSGMYGVYLWRQGFVFQNRRLSGESSDKKAITARDVLLINENDETQLNQDEFKSKILLASPPKEPEPYECCGNGCEPCVWTLYFNELAIYTELQQKTDTTRKESG